MLLLQENITELDIVPRTCGSSICVALGQYIGCHAQLSNGLGVAKWGLGVTWFLQQRFQCLRDCWISDFKYHFKHITHVFEYLYNLRRMYCYGTTLVLTDDPKKSLSVASFVHFRRMSNCCYSQIVYITECWDKQIVVLVNTNNLNPHLQSDSYVKYWRNLNAIFYLTY